VTVDLLHRAEPAKHTDEGLRALSGESPIRPESVQKYLESKFGEALEEVSRAMLELAKSLPPLSWRKKPTPYTKNSGRKFLLAKKDGELPACWTWTSSARWLQPDPEAFLIYSLKKGLKC
jgi:hypothetical protein